MKKILILGASGNVGRPLVETLLASGLAVKAATRSGAPIHGAEGVAFDFNHPEKLASHLADVDRAYVMLPTGYVQANTLLAPVVDLLAGRGIKIVLQSVFGVDADDSIPYRQVELQLERTGVAHVILRPNWFADNFHTFWKEGIRHGVIAVPAGDGQSSFIDARDIAASAATALTSSSFDGRAFNLTGPHALDYAEAAARIGAALQREVRYQALEDEAFVSLLVQAGVPSDYASFLASIFYPVRTGWTATVTDDVHTLTSRAATSFDQYLNDHLAQLRD